MTNAEIAKLLRQVAAVYEVKDQDFFRTSAYQNAANSIENLTVSVHDLWEQGKLDEIPGVGPGLSEHLDELLKSGKVKHFDHELKRVPAGMFALLGIRGVGPKTAFKIAKRFRLNDPNKAIIEVARLIRRGELEELPGFGKKLEQKIKTSIEEKFTKEERMLLYRALPVADTFLEYIKTLPEVISAEPLGSLRRHLATVGDIDVAICTKNPKEAMKKALKYQEISKVISSGESVGRIKLKSGHEIDIKLASPDEWGSLLQHYTGSKLHNIALRSLALKKHLSLSEHGIKNTKTNKVFKAKDENDFYAHLGLPYIPPELREGEEELDLAKKNKIPKLIEPEDIKGDLHIHSDFDFETSHDLGTSPLSEILDKARELNYEYIGISDHNPKFTGLTLNEKRKILGDRKKYLTSEYQKYEKRVKSRVPKLLIGLEIDIRSDGELALEQELINLLDYAVISVHTSFNLTKEGNTNRIIKAFENPKAIILGHPTTRKLNIRKGIDCDWEKVFRFCQEKTKVLEINAYPDRLDLPDDMIKMAVKIGVKMAIDTDSHHADQLDYMRYGVWTGRRGWATKTDVINTYSYKDLQKLLQ